MWSVFGETISIGLETGFKSMDLSVLSVTFIFGNSSKEVLFGVTIGSISISGVKSGTLLMVESSLLMDKSCSFCNSSSASKF